MKGYFSQEAYFQANNQLWLVTLCVITFLVSYFSPVSTVDSDPRGSLLVSQAILEHGTIRLDTYSEVLTSYQFVERDGHYYYDFPLGTSIYAIPFVWLANLRGEDMSDFGDDSELQNLLSALTTTLSYLLIYIICRAYLDFGYSFLFSSAFVFGSSIVSTMGTALWSTNFAVVFILVTLAILVYDHRCQMDAANPHALGFLLFSAYLCRPTASIFALATFLYVFWRKRSIFLKLVATYAVPSGVFVLFSLLEFRQMLPEYYLPTRLTQANTFGLALYGNLFSPARGLLVYSPYLILTLIASIYFAGQLHRNALFWFAVGWFALHLVVMSRFIHWWGGWSFGSRLFTDAFPALILLTLLVWDQGLGVMPPLGRRVAIAVFAVLATLSVFINTYQGLFNTFALEWNVSPNIDLHPEYLFDWRYPQFLASPQLLAQRNREHQLKRLQAYRLGEVIKSDGQNAVFESWYNTEETPRGNFRWSRGKSARIYFEIESLPADANDDLILEISMGSNGAQRVGVFVNGNKVGSIVHQDFWPSQYRFPVDMSVLNVSQNNTPQINTLEFSIPDAVSPASVDPDSTDARVLGISIWQVAFRAVYRSR